MVGFSVRSVTENGVAFPRRAALTSPYESAAVGGAKLNPLGVPAEVLTAMLLSSSRLLSVSPLPLLCQKIPKYLVL